MEVDVHYASRRLQIESLRCDIGGNQDRGRSPAGAPGIPFRTKGMQHTVAIHAVRTNACGLASDPCGALTEEVDHRSRRGAMATEAHGDRAVRETIRQGLKCDVAFIGGGKDFVDAIDILQWCCLTRLGGRQQRPPDQLFERLTGEPPHCGSGQSSSIPRLEQQRAIAA